MALLFVTLPPGHAGPALLERERLRALLTQLGWEVTAARTLEDAVRCLARGRADLFVCDLGVPLARETRTLSRCRRANPTVPFLLLSPLDSPEENSVAASHGTILYKPAEAPGLAAAMQRLFHPETTPEKSHPAVFRPARRPAPTPRD